MNNNKNNNIIKLKEKNQPKSRNHSISLTTAGKNKLIYEIFKERKLNELKNKAHRLSVIMDSIGDSLNSKKRNSKNVQDDLLTQNLTKINFRKSLLIQKKLKDLDKLNEEFDKEFINQKYDEKDNKDNNYDSSSEDEFSNNNGIQKDINLDFNSEQNRILKILFRKNKNNENRPFSDYKRNKKLNDLKSNIEYVCGIKLTEENDENRKTENELTKNSHYFIPKRNPCFVRDKLKNDSFTPSMKYDKSKIFAKKKYGKSQIKNDKNRQYPTLQSYFSKIKYSYRNKLFLNKKEISPIKKSKIKSKNDEENNELENLPDLKNEDFNDTKYKTLDSTKNFCKLRLKKISQNTKRNNSKIYIKKLKTENNISDRKKISFLLTNLLKETYTLNNDLKFVLNIITSHLKDYKNTNPKKESKKNDLNIAQLRKDLNLIKMKPIIRESDIIIKNEKKIEKIIRKEDAVFLKRVVNTVLQEDRLANKNFVYNSNSLSSKLKKILERKIKDRNIIENIEPEEEKKQIFKLFKNDQPNFFNINHLSNLIKRYKTMKIK
jgi:hypothetical protein